MVFTAVQILLNVNTLAFSRFNTPAGMHKGVKFVFKGKQIHSRLSHFLIHLLIQKNEFGRKNCFRR